MNPSQNASKLRLALVGAGGISKAHARAILEGSGQVACTAICDIGEQQRVERQEQLGGGAALYSDWRTMLSEMAGEIDAVVICLPHHLHAAAILDAVKAGKHILCEKPLCIDLDEADRIVEAVKASGVCFMAGHNQLFLPIVREAKRLIDDGLIGDVRWLRSTDSFLMGHMSGDAWRANAKLQGGGELIDTGYHPTYRLLFLANSPVAEVKAVMGRFQLDIEGEDSASVVLSFANGTIGEIMSSWAWQPPYGSYQIHVIGSKGQIFGSDNTLYHLDAGATVPEKKELPPADTFTAQMDAFAECVLRQKRPLHSVEESREVLRVILTASRNAAGWEDRTQRAVTGNRSAGEPSPVAPG